MNTSASTTSFIKISRPASSRMSRSMPRLFLCIETQHPDWSPFTAPVMRITSGTPTFSMKMTSAPCSASHELAQGPATALDTSTTLIPARGPVPFCCSGFTSSNSDVGVSFYEIDGGPVPALWVMGIDCMGSWKINYFDLRNESHSG